MSASYFGKMAAGNSELVARLKAGKTITVVVEQRILKFIADNQLDSDMLDGVAS